jgi:hypothetical protein
MSFTFVNKNLLIPQIEIYKEFNTPVQKLLDMCHGADKVYCKNLYIVSEDCIYFTNGKNLYTVSKSNLIEKIDVKIPNKSHLKILSSFLNSENNNVLINDESDESDANDESYNNQNSDMNIGFGVCKTKNKITIKNDPTKKLNNKKEENEFKSRTQPQPKLQPQPQPQPKPKSKEELQLLKLCEETMEIYQTEVRKIKEIEHKIKLLENNKKSLLKKQKEKIFVNFSKLKNDYNTFKMINTKLTKKPDMDIPSLFVLKYNYFVKLLESADNLKILSQVEDLNLDVVLNSDRELDQELQIFVNEYGVQSKKLNVKFDHSYEDLELDADSSETNNSRFGGN